MSQLAVDLLDSLVPRANHVLPFNLSSDQPMDENRRIETLYTTGRDHEDNMN